MTKSRAPLILAVVLLLLPVLYVGSYLALVVPVGIEVEYPPDRSGKRWRREAHYRAGAHQVCWMFWPLEQIDRRIRPRSWR